MMSTEAAATTTTNRRPARSTNAGLSGSILKKSSTGGPKFNAPRTDSEGGSGICWNKNVQSAKAFEGGTHVREEDFRISALDADFKPEEAGFDQSGTIEYYTMDESVTSNRSRRLSAMWDDLILRKSTTKGGKQKGCFTEEKGSPVDDEGDVASPKVTKRFDSFDSFGLSIDDSDRNEDEHERSEGSLTFRMRRTLQAFASFGADSAIPEGEEEDEAEANDVPVPKQRNKNKRGSISLMNMVISFKNQPFKSKKESTSQDEEVAPRVEPKPARRGSIAKVVDSIQKKKSSKKKEQRQDEETGTSTRAAETSPGQANVESSAHEKPKRRNSIVKLANAIKFSPASPFNNSNTETEMTCGLDQSDKSKPAASNEPQPKTRQRRRNRRATTDESFRNSAKKFTQLASTGSGRRQRNTVNGRVRLPTVDSFRSSAAKFNDLAEIRESVGSSSSKATTCRTSSLSTQSASRESFNSSTGMKIIIGEGCDNKISSILYADSTRRRATQ